MILAYEISGTEMLGSVEPVKFCTLLLCCQKGLATNIEKRDINNELHLTAIFLILSGFQYVKKRREEKREIGDEKFEDLEIPIPTARKSHKRREGEEMELEN